MDNVFANDDDFGWEGLACPPLDEYAFNNFDVACFDVDAILDDALLEEEDSRGFIKHTNEIVRVDDKKTKICYGNHGKGKQVKINLNMAGFLGDETEQVAVKKTKICYGNHGIGKQLKLNLNMTADEAKEVAPKKKNILECYDCESLQHKERLCSPKYRVRQDQPAGVVDNKRKAVAGIDEDEATRHKLHKSSESALMMFHHSTQPAVTYNKLPTDYNSRYEATRHKLHKLYDGIAEAKQQRRIQVIDFQKPVTEQPKCRAKAKGKTSLRQKLIAMGTHSCMKKFQPCVY